MHTFYKRALTYSYGNKRYEYQTAALLEKHVSDKGDSMIQGLRLW